MKSFNLGTNQYGATSVVIALSVSAPLPTILKEPQPPVPLD